MLDALKFHIFFTNFNITNDNTSLKIILAYKLTEEDKNKIKNEATTEKGS